MGHTWSMQIFILIVHILQVITFPFKVVNHMEADGGMSNGTEKCIKIYIENPHLRWEGGGTSAKMH